MRPASAFAPLRKKIQSFLCVFRTYCLVALPALILFSGCAVWPRDVQYAGPVERPQTVYQYYQINEMDPYESFTEEMIRKRERFNHKKIRIQTDFGEITIDYFYGRTPNPNLIFVFPILGGKNFVEGHFARYFAARGFDCAIVNRDKDFKRPEMFERLEENFRNNVVRDRIAIRFFEREYSKKLFGSFGISRGAINAAITADAEPRLKYSVSALGGSHLLEIFKKSDVPGIEKYRARVMEYLNITSDEFFRRLEVGIRTDPKNFAKYIDARKTMMILSVFDQAVPFRYGMKLRREIGIPKTVFIVSGHYTALLYTNIVKALPFDFVESEALSFFNEMFETKRVNLLHYPFQLLQLPFTIIGDVYYAIL